LSLLSTLFCPFNLPTVTSLSSVGLRSDTSYSSSPLSLDLICFVSLCLLPVTSARLPQSFSEADRQAQHPHLADDSALPSTLESHFRKLKSLPATPIPAPVKTLGHNITVSHASTLLHPPQPNPTPQQTPASTPSAALEEQHPREDAARKKDNSPPPHQARPPVVVIPVVHDDHDNEDLFSGSGGGHGRLILRERNRGRDDNSSTSS
jgi:hypothetical protein